MELSYLVCSSGLEGYFRTNCRIIFSNGRIFRGKGTKIFSTNNNFWLEEDCYYIDDNIGLVIRNMTAILWYNGYICEGNLIGVLSISCMITKADTPAFNIHDTEEEFVYDVVSCMDRNVFLRYLI